MKSNGQQLEKEKEKKNRKNDEQQYTKQCLNNENTWKTMKNNEKWWTTMKTQWTTMKNNEKSRNNNEKLWRNKETQGNIPFGKPLAPMYLLYLLRPRLPSIRAGCLRPPPPRPSVLISALSLCKCLCSLSAPLAKGLLCFPCFIQLSFDFARISDIFQILLNWNKLFLKRISNSPSLHTYFLKMF